jgi:hypothetical protein
VKQAQFAAVNGCTAEPSATTSLPPPAAHLHELQRLLAGHPTEYCVFDGRTGGNRRIQVNRRLERPGSLEVITQSDTPTRAAADLCVRTAVLSLVAGARVEVHLSRRPRRASPSRARPDNPVNHYRLVDVAALGGDRIVIGVDEAWRTALDRAPARALTPACAMMPSCVPASSQRFPDLRVRHHNVGCRPR